ncbi:MAG: hypothetical protein ABJM18_06865 [Hyphomonas sp.]
MSIEKLLILCLAIASLVALGSFFLEQADHDESLYRKYRELLEDIPDSI